MHPPHFSTKAFICFCIGIILLIGVAILQWTKLGENHEPLKSGQSAQMPETPSPESDSIDTTAPASPAREPKTARKPVDSERSWGLANEGGRAFVLALDECVLRDADGKETLVKIDPPATGETLPQRLANLGAWPVVYLTGEPRNEATRRVVTPDLRVRLDGANPTDVARGAALEIKDLPDYTSGWPVFAADDPFAALAAMDRLRATRHASAADPPGILRCHLRRLTLAWKFRRRDPPQRCGRQHGPRNRLRQQHRRISQHRHGRIRARLPLRLR